MVEIATTNHKSANLAVPLEDAILIRAGSSLAIITVMATHGTAQARVRRGSVAILPKTARQPTAHSASVM
jgi:hypothetical protein